MRKKRLALAAGVCVAAIIIVVVVVRLGPPPGPRPVLDSSIVTYNCRELVSTSLKAHADIIDDGGDWVTRRGFQYAVSNEKDLPDIIPLLNASFEYGNPPVGWAYSRGICARSDVQARTGSYCASLVMNEQESSAVILQDIADYAGHIGNYVVMGAWVYATETNQARIMVSEGVTTSWSGYHTGRGGWEFLVTEPLMVAEAADRLRVHFYTYSTEVAYVDGVVLVEDRELRAVFEDGEFGTGTYALDITGLELETVSVVRAFAENRAGVSYGNTVTCRTP